MNIKELKEKIQDLPDEMKVYVPINASRPFDGFLFSPCIESSGPIGMATEDLTREEMERLELLKQPLPTETQFMLVPCGYFELEEQENKTELN